MRSPVWKGLDVLLVDLPVLGVIRMIIFLDDIGIVDVVEPVLCRDEGERPDGEKMEREKENDAILRTASWETTLRYNDCPICCCSHRVVSPSASRLDVDNPVSGRSIVPPNCPRPSAGLFR